MKTFEGVDLEGLAFALKIEDLSPRHSRYTRGVGDFAHDLDVARSSEHFECHRQQGVARENRQRFAERSVQGGSTAAHVVVVQQATVQGFSPDVVIAVNLGHRTGRSPRPRHLLHMAMRVTGIAAKQNTRLSETKADIVIRPSTATFPSFDLMASTRLLQVGYDAAMERIPDIQAALEAAEPTWVKRLKFWERKTEKP